MIVNPLTLQALDQLIANPVHAVALSAPAGAGKGHLSRYIASKLLLSDTLEDHPYLKQIDAVHTKVGIDEVRELQRFLSLTVPGKATIRRVIIIEGIDHLGHEAQNALLKTLEEPPTDTVIIVTYENEQQVLSTIQSRVHSLRVLPVTLEIVLESMTDIDSNDVSRAYHMSGGYVGLLWSLTHDQADHPLFAAIDEARVVLKQARHERIAYIDKITKSKTVTPATLLDGLYRLLNAGYHASVATKSNADLKTMSQRLRLVESAIYDLHHNVQAKLVLTKLFYEL